jgi:hypothetical protein
MNVIWSEEEYNSMADGYLDYDTTMTKQTVCKVSLTIEMYSRKLFSSYWREIKRKKFFEVLCRCRNHNV